MVKMAEKPLEDEEKSVFTDVMQAPKTPLQIRHMGGKGRG